MIKWYGLKPVDTFFFKGSTPMVMGENHSSEFRFPPPVETIAGAIRTSVLIQNDIKFKDYNDNNFDNTNIIKSIGKAGENPPFEIIGPLLEMANQLYIPAPFTWYMEKNDKNYVSIQTDNKVKNDEPEPIIVYKSKRIESSFVKTEHMDRLYIAKGKKGELSSIGGKWIKLDDFLAEIDGNADLVSEIVVLDSLDFYNSEPRTGIALEENRKVRESHLYTFNHIRMKENVKVVFGINSHSSLPLSKSGIIKLGAEQRFGYYETMEVDIPVSSKASGLFMSLSEVETSKASEKNLIATGKIQYIGGWDMKKGFHKPAKGFYPAGSVFTKYDDNSLIRLQEEQNV